MKVLIPTLDRVITISVYALVFILPFSKSGIEIAAHIAIFTWLIKKIIIHKLRITRFFPKTPLNTPIFAFFAVAFLSMILSVNFALSAKGVFLKLGEYILLFYVFLDFFSEVRDRDKRIRTLLGVASVSAFLLFADAVFQLITGSDLVRAREAGKWQLCASFDRANGFAGWIITVFPLIWAGLFTDSTVFPIRPAMRKLIFFILSVTAIIMLGMTQSRGGWLGFSAGMAFIGAFVFISTEKPLKVFSAFTIICLFISLLAGISLFPSVRKNIVSITEGFSRAGRKEYVWREALSMINDFPVKGTGPNTYTYVSRWYKLKEGTGYYPHNSYLHMAAETGLLGLGAFLWILLRFFKSASLKIKQSGDILLLALSAGILAFLIQSFFDTNLFALQLAALFWIMLGIGATRAL